MFGAQNLYHHLPNFGAVLLRMQHAPRLPLCYPLHLCMQLPSENHYVINICPVLLGILSSGGGEVLRASAHCIL